MIDVSSSESEPEVAIKKPFQFQAKVKPYRKPTTVASKTNSTPKSTAKLAPKTPSTTPLKIKAETPSAGSDHSTALEGDLKDLPAWITGEWVRQYLPTLYAFFFASEQPFEHFSKTDTFVDIVQMIVHLVYPDASYTAKLGDPIVQKVRHIDAKTPIAIANSSPLWLVIQACQRKAVLSGELRHQSCREFLQGKPEEVLIRCRQSRVLQLGSQRRWAGSLARPNTGGLHCRRHTSRLCREFCHSSYPHLR